MLTGYNTDIRHNELVLHVQTEDKGMSNPSIETVIYLRGRVLAAKRTGYERLLNQGKGDKEVAVLMEHQHRSVLAAIKAGRFDGKIEQAISSSGRERETTGAQKSEEARQADPFAGRVARDGAGTAGEAGEGPSLDQVILDYLAAEAELEHLVLVLDGNEEIRPRRTNHLTLRAFSSKSGLPVAGVQVAVKMLSTVMDPRTLLVAQTDDVGTLEFQLDVPEIERGSVALVIAGASELGRAEIKQLL